MIITKKQGESKDVLLRKFSRMFVEENVVDEVRKKLFYKKPSLLKKEREKERIKNKARIYSRSRA
ncbi:30S ribosomal protein S21 [Candidatus Roizmanbacteria bacterium RIFCSPLOWO2_12_FULL_40_12]|uniref:Small ribosomal subunit protein bS21 n=1 Tax=Candidatus Roizmanbacteria bacterium RIFCSPLOWO2_01_FULL_40_42 TaxID=1802066 RepID=A0A1F7J5I7_9BACT|nr:MAG: 30S ribosomal protein S21 [Candidatus Roizmanbacteria bacterium RIFCSPHIGHO2_01_FULL_40_98]OGK28317.1 MAG: 30S ribosomal protein S21 [Candidatus Roizmanbacteria bacterium RIFCSPHIGHO2_02_FULL_40_53]OGK30553.1 MAG: 30S ribosomal protein S21 [Candidatus Roizmanbacteria bacterium RIFCSPHIGHO2_12_41_18]OGK36967.1 MAG: 30S ribosomal protein S21 [Candidatus Roizmanbacteria bacterium RIFCSPHIGHO2_12_FULL_40_130]OGK50873.1 MAG: 30S ribosomal protein S21 [Candidatus Roizmanbacteria bacterium RIF